MGSKITAVRLTDEDREIVAVLRERYSLPSTSAVIRFSLKMAVAMPTPPQAFGNSPDVFIIPKSDETGIVEAVGTGPQRPVVEFTRRKMIFENEIEK